MSSMDTSALTQEMLVKMFAAGKRFDGRKLLEQRDFTVEYNISNKAEGSARVHVVAHRDVEALWAHGRRLVEPTRFHGPAKNQCGADCNWAQNYTTDAYAHGLRHPLALLGELFELGRA